MTNHCLSFGSQIAVLEQSHMWQSACESAYRAWKETPMELQRLLCAGTEAMYCLLEADYDNLDPRREQAELIPLEPMQEFLSEVTRFGMDHFADNAVFNAYFGYMMYLRPYFFFDGNYATNQEMGQQMQARAVHLEPENPFVAALGIASNKHYDDGSFEKACAHFWKEESPMNWCKSGVSCWFYYVLHGNHYHGELKKTGC